MTIQASKYDLLGEPLQRLALDYLEREGAAGLHLFLASIFGPHVTVSSSEKYFQRLAGWSKRRQAALEKHAAQLAATKLDPLHPELRDRERQLKEQQAAISVLRRQLDEADAKRSVVESLMDVVRQEITPWEPRPWAARPSDSDRFPVSGAVSLSDEHADEVISGAGTWGLERYNFDVFRIRLARWAKTIGAYVTEHLPRYRFEDLWVLKLGDSVHGNLHLPGQKYRNHFGNDLRAAIAAGEAEADAIARLLDVVPRLTVVSVPGNHPRQTVRKDYGDPHDNLDFLVTTVLELRLRSYVEAGRLRVFAPRAYSAFIDIRGWVNVLNHGDDVVGTWSIPWYGFAKHEQRMQALLARTGSKADYFWYGHFHTDVGKSENGSRSIHSGAFTLTDDYVVNKLKAGNEPSQVLEVFDTPRGRILEVPLYVRDSEREQQYWEGKYEPELGRTSALTRLAWTDELAAEGKLPLIRRA